MATRKKVKSKSDSTGSVKHRRKLVSELMVQPTMNAAVSIGHLNRQIDFRQAGSNESVMGLDSFTLLDELTKTGQQIGSGDLGPLEEMLLAQAKTLDALFHRYLHRMDSADYLPKAEAYARIAMKAQHQSRQTIVTLGELKHPKRATFIKQQNNAVNQQINQGGAQNDSSAEKPENFEQSQNKLLEQDDGERLEPGTAQAASETDSTMATVGKLNRTQD